MAQDEELEIEIGADGRVKVHVKGRPGAACLDYVELFQTLLGGPARDQELTPEYYQSENQAHSRLHQRASAGAPSPRRREP